MLLVKSTAKVVKSFNIYFFMHWNLSFLQILMLHYSLFTLFFIPLHKNIGGGDFQRFSESIQELRIL